MRVVGAGVCDAVAECGGLAWHPWQRHATASTASSLHPTHPRARTPTSRVQLPCFGYGKPVESLRARFKPELSDAAAAAAMLGMIRGAYDKWTTGGYDVIQYWQNAIPK